LIFEKSKMRMIGDRSSELAQSMTDLIVLF
jgi:hypothetical protein